MKIPEKPFYDKNFVEIQPNDLLKIDHFKIKNKKHYMYQIAVLNADGYWQGKDYHKNGNKGHYRLLSSADKNRVIHNCRIIYKPDWKNELRLKREAKTRKKKLTPNN